MQSNEISDERLREMIAEQKRWLAQSEADEQANRRGNYTDRPCWYASVQDAGRTALVLGPFATEMRCREWAYRDGADGGDTRKHARLLKAAECDPKSWFYAWGMTLMANGHRDGVLNRKLAEAETDMHWEPLEVTA